jgi:hypothetical protein
MGTLFRAMTFVEITLAKVPIGMRHSRCLAMCNSGPLVRQ